ncbi:MAG: hypoxanthine-guanine phosphoribosyltransferase [Proteobacteria bacterium]|nr:hypoxanthine-guanine phosphoribosyltransferase [Pseudomonadota bacterium]
MKQDNLLPDNCTLLVSKKKIKKNIKKMAKALNTDYAGKSVVYLTIMNGGMIFAADLAKKLNINMEMDYVQVSRYGIETHGGQLIWKHQCETSLKNKHVILVDDIFDEGYTLQAVHEWALAQGAKTAKSVVLVSKNHNRGYADHRPDYSAIEVADLYIFGYGMDYQEKLRHLDEIYYLK